MSDTREQLANRLATLSPEQRALLAQRLQQQQGASATVGPAGAASAPATIATDQGIAIVSAACRLPGGVRSPAQFWQMLIDGVDAVREVPPERWDGASMFSTDPDDARRMNSRWGGFLDGIDRFDAAFFGISPKEAALMDPQQRLLLETAWEALESGAQVADRLAGSATGVFIGAHSHSSDYRLLQLAQAAGIEAHASTGSAHSILANRISYLLDLRGPSVCVDTACSSSLVAVHLACQSLRTGESDLALAGGVNLMLLPPASLEFAKLQILSPSGRCRSFDAAADGIARGEGCGLVVLKRLVDAQRDGDPVLAVIRGSAVNQDGASNGLTAPNGPAQEAVVRRAFKLAGIEPQRLGLVETHGTGTALGDPVEVEALAKVIGAPRSAAQRCWLGAVKTNIGHLEGAAGIAGLIKAVLCLQHRRIPKNLHFGALNPHITLAGTALAIPTEVVEWPSDGAPRVAAVSSFGFGGTNAHVVIEEHATAAAVPVERPAELPALPRLLPLSARDANALRELAQAHLTHLEALPALEPAALASFAHSAAAGRTHHAWRLAVVGDTAAAVAQALRDRLDDAAQPSHAAAAGVVFVYTGQGGHWPGAGRELHATEPAFRAALEDVAARFERLAGWSPLPDLVEGGAERAVRLMATEVAQPVLFALQVALTALWRALGLAPAAVVGHSVGEVAAAWAAGVLSLDDAVAVVWHRSRLMQSAAGAGRMAQVDLPAAQVAAELRRHGGGLEIAGFNGPASTVVAGEPALLEGWLEDQGRRGVSARKLGLDYAFHSAQMAHFCAPLAQALSRVAPQPATLPLVSTVTGTWAAAGDFNAAYWARNVREPVRFAQAAEALLGAGYHAYLEVGPHPALGAGLHASAAAAGVVIEVAASLRRERPARVALLGSLAALYEAGAAIDWRAQSAAGARWVPLPTYPWQRERHWLPAPNAQALARHVFGTLPAAASAAPATGAYELAWEPMAPAARVDIGGLAAEIDRAAKVAPSAARLAADADSTPALEARAVAHAWWALRDLGVAGAAGERIDAARTAALGIATRHERLWSAMLDRLVEASLLRRTDTAGGAAWQVIGSAPPGRPEVPERPDPAAGAPRIELVLLDRCGAMLAEVLRGHTDPLSLLFPNDPSLPSAGTMYAAANTAVLCNEMTAEAVARATRSLARPRLRVLEVGAGTGAATTAIVLRLPAGTHYTFTDLSAGFFDAARERFASSALELDLRTLDIEQPPADQGFARGQVDVLVASNIVHATGDLRQTLAHIRWLLAPGGVLVMLETVASRFWQTLTFGLTSGWWRFRDTDLRVSGPVLPTERWLALLRETGYDDAAAAITQATATSLHPQALVLGRASAVPMPGTRWLLVADDSGVAAALADRLRAEGSQCEVVAAARVAREGESALPAPGAGTRWHGIVHCGALDEAADAAAAATGGFTAAGAAATAGPMTGAPPAAAPMDALLAAQAIARWIAACALPPRLWIVTRGAQPVREGERVRSPWQAPLWALGRSMALEMPVAWGGLVDLGADDGSRQGAAEAAEALLQELAAAQGEDQVALRGSARWCLRLDLATPLPAGRPVLGGAGSYVVTGGMGSLGARFARWLAARGARHIVLTSRSGTASDPAGLQALESHLKSAHPGTSLQCLRADAADGATMQTLFATLRGEGRPVRGVVHAAAAFDHTPMAARSDASWRDALAAKVQGAWWLHQLTRGEPTDLFVLCSSITALLGAKGLSAYAAGNEFLGALAEMRKGMGLAATCVDWGTWAEPRAQLLARRGDVASLGFADLDEAFAFDQLDRMVTSGKARQAIAAVDWACATAAYGAAGARPMLARLAGISAAASASAAANRSANAAVSGPAELTAPGARLPTAQNAAQAQAALTQVLLALPPQDRAAQVATLVRAELTRVLGMGQARQIAGDTGFFALGLDSLMAVQLRRRLGARTGLELGATVTFNHPSVDALAAHLLARLLDGGPAVLAPQPARPIQTTAAEQPAPPAAPNGAVQDDQIHALLRAELEALPADLRDDLRAGGLAR